MSRTHDQNGRPLWVEALLDTRLSAVECRVLMYLLWRQGDNGSSWPSQVRISAALGLTTDGVRKIIGRLAEKRWVHIMRPLHTARGSGLQYQTTKPEIAQTAIGAIHPDGGMGDGEEHPDSEAEIAQTAGCAHNNEEHSHEHLQVRTRAGSSRKKPKAKSSRRRTKPTAFVPPTVNEVRAYAEGQGDPQFDAAYFVQWYQDRGWTHKGNKPMRDWQQTVRDWIRRDNQRRIERGEPPHDGFSQYGTHPATEEEIEALQKAGVL